MKRTIHSPTAIGETRWQIGQAIGLTGAKGMRFNPQIRTNLTRGLFLAALLASLNANAQEVSVRGEPVSKSDIAALNPVCRLIMENPGINHTIGQKRNAELFERPEYNMAKGNGHIHHYCWSLIHKQRYFRERNKGKRDFYFSQYLGDIDYVLKHSDKNWPYFDVMHLEVASMYMILGDYSTSIKKADEALRAKPGTEKAYVIKSDAYKGMGKKDMAIKVAEEGLRENPESSQIRRRLVKLGVTPPDLPQQPDKVVAPANPAASGAGTKSIEEAGTEGINSGETGTGPAVGGKEREERKGASSTTTGDSSVIPEDQKDSSVNQPKNNPYCRFCP